MLFLDLALTIKFSKMGLTEDSLDVPQRPSSGGE